MPSSCVLALPVVKVIGWGRLAQNRMPPNKDKSMMTAVYSTDGTGTYGGYPDTLQGSTFSCHLTVLSQIQARQGFVLQGRFAWSDVL